MKKIIIFNISGIGNAILFTPTLKKLREKFKKFKIVLFVRNRAIADIFSGSKYVDKIIIFNNKNLLQKIRVLNRLRKFKWDYSITAFPSNKFQFNLLAFLVGAKKRITHRYNVGRIKTLSFLQNTKILVNEDIHDVEQNINLLKAFKIKDNKREKIFFHISNKDRYFAKNFFQKKDLNKFRVIGIHPGCKKKDKARRWPRKNFIRLINKLNEDKKNKVFLFSGPDEEEFVKSIYKKIKEKPLVIKEKNLKSTGAIIERCKLFLSTDSGLGHIAAALKVPTIAIFGPANYKRTGPYGKRCYVIHANLKKPLLKYPFKSTSDKLNIKKAKESLEKISVEEVFKKINSLI